MANKNAKTLGPVNGQMSEQLQAAITPPVIPPPMGKSALELEIERLKAENERLKAKGMRSGTLSLRVSEKGALSVYGLMRFPVSLYREQWERLLAITDEIKAFIVENDKALKVKGQD